MQAAMPLFNKKITCQTLVNNFKKQSLMVCKKYFCTILICIVLSAFACHAQEDNTKAFLFLGIFCEESASYFDESSDIVKAFHTIYDSFSYECTQPLRMPVGYLPLDTLWDDEKYTIQLFKITRLHDLPHYIMKFSSCQTYLFSFRQDLWIRIAGYKESDLKVFFDALRERGLKKKEILEMVDRWRNSDAMFREIDWDCLLKGYFKNDTHLRCYVSTEKIWYNMRYFGEEDDIYATFSKKPLAGTLTKFD